LLLNLLFLDIPGSFRQSSVLSNVTSAPSVYLKRRSPPKVVPYEKSYCVYPCTRAFGHDCRCGNHRRSCWPDWSWHWPLPSRRPRVSPSPLGTRPLSLLVVLSPTSATRPGGLYRRGARCAYHRGRSDAALFALVGVTKKYATPLSFWALGRFSTVFTPRLPTATDTYIVAVMLAAYA